jgi:hypothetical protein
MRDGPRICLEDLGAVTLERLEGREALEGLKLATVLKCLERSEVINDSPGPGSSLALGLLLRLGDRDADRSAFVVTLFEQSVGDFDRLQTYFVSLYD